MIVGAFFLDARVRSRVVLTVCSEGPATAVNHVASASGFSFVVSGGSKPTDPQFYIRSTLDRPNGGQGFGR